MGAERILLGDDAETEAFLDGLYDGVVSKVTGDLMTFVIPDIDKQQMFGPAPFPRPVAVTGAASGGTAHTHDLAAPNDPPKGTKVLAGFVDGDPERPRILAVYGWPTI